MAITVRKFNAQVKDPNTGNMVPAGLLSSDALEAIETAKTRAVNTIDAEGEAVRESLPQTWNDLSDTVDSLENYLTGTYSISASELVSGTWWYGATSPSSTRARTPHLIPVRSGMIFTYTVVNYDVFFSVLETPESGSYYEFGSWRSTSGSVTITKNGYLSFVIRSHSDQSAEINPSEWDGTAIITVNGSMRQTIPNGTDFDTITLPGTYFISSSSSSNYSNCPMPVGYSGTLEVFIGLGTRSVQRITRLSNGDMYIRTAFDANSFVGREWNYVPSRGQSAIPAGTDLNTITKVGLYFVSASESGYTNCPLPNSVAGTLEVFAGSSPFGSYLSLVQRMTRHSDGGMYIRTSITGSFENRDWHYILPMNNGVIPNGSNFNDLVSSGYYQINSGSSTNYVNSPFDSAEAGTLEVINNNGTITQRATKKQNGDTYIRVSSSNGTLSNTWYLIGSGDQGILPDGTNFMTLTSNGRYYINPTPNAPYRDNPLPSGVDGILEVIGSRALARRSIVLQKVTGRDATAGTYIRTSNSNGQFNSQTPWRYIASEEELLAEVAQRFEVDEALINYGHYDISASELVSGEWSYGSARDNTARARTSFLIPVHSGMRLKYTVANYNVFFGIVDGPGSTHYIEFGTPWRTSSGEVEVTTDGYLVVNIAAHNNMSANIEPAEWDGSFEVWAAQLNKGTIPSGTNFDSLVSEGAYVIDGAVSYSYVNSPLELSSNGILEVTVSDDEIMQRVTDSFTGATYIRSTLSNGSSQFNDDGWSLVGLCVRGSIPSNTNFNNIRQWGCYYIVPNQSYLNNPLADGVGGFLEVSEAANGILLQRVTELTYRDSTKGSYVRVSHGVSGAVSFSNSEWRYMPAFDELEQRMQFTEDFISTGTYSISKSELVSGVWNWSTPVSNSARARMPFLMPIYKGMKIHYSVANYDVHFGILETMNSSSYIEFGSWRTTSGTVTVTQNGYLTFNIRSHSDSTAAINPSDWDGEFIINTPFLEWVTGPLLNNLEPHLVPTLPQSAGQYTLKVSVIAGNPVYEWATV